MADNPAVEGSGSESMEDANPQVQKQADQAASPVAEPAKKPSLLKRAWAMTGLDPITIILMLKGALPPIICLAAYQSDAWAKKYSRLGYLSAIMSFLTLCIQPRAKFVQSTLVSIFFICFAAAVSLLQIRCITSARVHSIARAASHATIIGDSGGKQAVEYNASASVVAAVFLFVEIYLGNMVRAKRPQLLVPSIQFCIFAIVTSSYSVTFPTMVAGEAFVKRMLETFLTGIGIAAGVSFVVIPMTSRVIAGKQIAGILGLMKASMNAHSQYMMSLTKRNSQTNGHASDEKVEAKATTSKKPVHLSTLSAEAQALKGLRNALAGLFGKLVLEIVFARKEIAWGHLMPHHFSELVDLLRNIILPIAGVTTFIDIMQSVKDNKAHRADSGETDGETMAAIQRLEAKEWDEVIMLSHDEAVKLKGVLCQALTHVSYQLQIVKKPKAPKGDVEKSAGGRPAPGDAGFTAMLENEITDFAHHRESALQRWCNHKGIELPASFWDDPSQHYSMKDLQNMTETMAQKHNQQQLYLILYIEYLIFSMGRAILKLSRYADGKVEDGTMTKKRLIFPAWRKIVKLIEGAWKQEDSNGVEHYGEGPSSNIYLGDSFKARKNPEHLPPTNWFEKCADYLRVIPNHFRSDEAAFGFRAAVATMSIAVLNFIHQTQVFYQDQRVMWALLMIAISMSPQTGQGIFGFLARVFGTLVAMVSSIALWYIGGRKTGAIIPLFYLYIACGVWFAVKKPQFAIVGILSVVTAILILGYELQERKIGLVIATANGQPYYHIYLLAPYRLVTVVAGMAVCFIWTYFPYPITTHSTLRKDLGATLYLIANFYSAVHSTIDMRLHMGVKDRPGDKSSPFYPVEKARRKLFQKCLIMLNSLRDQSNFAKFDPNFGGPFPKEVRTVPPKRFSVFSLTFLAM
jgi:hypothetical protein